MPTNLLADVGAEFEAIELARHAHRNVEFGACDWPDLRRAILAYGGIGPSADWQREDYPADLYRASGKAPDLVALEAVRGAPWGDSGDDNAMIGYLQRSWAQWRGLQPMPAIGHRRTKAERVSVAPVPERKLRPGERSFSELVADLKRKHGADVDLDGLRPEYVKAYESGERISVARDGREYRGTVGATRGARPRFVLLLSIDL